MPGPAPQPVEPDPAPRIKSELPVIFDPEHGVHSRTAYFPGPTLQQLEDGLAALLAAGVPSDAVAFCPSARGPIDVLNFEWFTYVPRWPSVTPGDRRVPRGRGGCRPSLLARLLGRG